MTQIIEDGALLIVKPNEPGKVVRVDPVGAMKIASVHRNRKATRTVTTVAGKYVEPTDPPPDPPPPLIYDTSLPAGVPISGVVAWTSEVSSGTPDHMEFWLDDALYWDDYQAPWGMDFDTTVLTNGPHRFEVIGYDDAGAHHPAGGIIPVDNPVIPPDPPPPTSRPAFLGRPSSPKISRDGGTDVEISGVTIRGGSLSNPYGIGITLRNVNRAWIHDVDLADLIGGIYLYQCVDVIIEDIRSRNIGDGTRGSGHSNHIQYAECTGGAIRRGLFLFGRTEDALSTWHSGGHGPGKEILVEDNRVENGVSDKPYGRAYDSGSGTGVIMSDGAGSGRNGFIIVRRNRFVTPGQVGIQMIDGPGLQVYDNDVLGEKRKQSNNPMTTWEGTPIGENHHNRYYWRDASGNLIEPWFDGGVDPQVNHHDNVQTPGLDATALGVGAVDPTMLTS
jgi:hypothetical protein